MKQKIKTLIYIFLPLIIGGLIGFIIKDSIDYSNLNQPILSPPKILFPIVWSILYLIIGIAYYLYRKYNHNNKVIKLYYVQLFVNYFWSIFFFLLKWRFFSILWIIFLLTIIIYIARLFKNSSKISYYLFIPYIVWVMFATYLNIGIFILN